MFLIDENNLYFDCIDFETVEYYLQKLFSIVLTLAKCILNVSDEKMTVGSYFNLL